MIEKIKDPCDGDPDFELAEPTTPLQQSQRNVRDYFAGQIMSGVVSNPDKKFTDESKQDVIEEVFDTADMMLKESVRRGGW